MSTELQRTYSTRRFTVVLNSNFLCLDEHFLPSNWYAERGLPKSSFNGKTQNIVYDIIKATINSATTKHSLHTSHKRLRGCYVNWWKWMRFKDYASIYTHSLRGKSPAEQIEIFENQSMHKATYPDLHDIYLKHCCYEKGAVGEKSLRKTHIVIWK